MSNNKKKILIVATSLDKGGAERASAVQSKIFSLLGYEVVIATILSGVAYDYSGTIFNLGDLKKKDDSWTGRIKRLLIFRKFLKQQKFDFIVDNRSRNQSYREFIISKFIYNAPVIYMIHSYDKSVAFTKYNWLSRYLYKNNFMVAVSDGVAEKFRDMYRLRKIRIIQNALDFDMITKQSLLNRQEEIREKYVIYYGRIHDYSKNLKLLLQAYSASELTNNNIKLIIVGDGPDLSMIENFSAELGLKKHVFFKGFIKNPFPLVKNAHFTVLTSRSEGFALVLAESLLLETPVISVECEAGPKEIIQHEVNGLLVENHNVDALSNEMNRLINDSELYRRCKLNAKQSIKRFGLKDASKEWSSLFKEISKKPI